jgi:hypothetical protein
MECEEFDFFWGFGARVVAKAVFPADEGKTRGVRIFVLP